MSQIFIVFAVAKFDERIALFLLLLADAAFGSGGGGLFAYIDDLGGGQAGIGLVEVCCH